MNDITITSGVASPTYNAGNILAGATDGGSKITRGSNDAVIGSSASTKYNVSRAPLGALTGASANQGGAQGTNDISKSIRGTPSIEGPSFLNTSNVIR